MTADSQGKVLQNASGMVAAGFKARPASEQYNNRCPTDTFYIADKPRPPKAKFEYRRRTVTRLGDAQTFIRVIKEKGNLHVYQSYPQVLKAWEDITKRELGLLEIEGFLEGPLIREAIMACGVQMQ